jgi:hypothetical protein
MDLCRSHNKPAEPLLHTPLVVPVTLSLTVFYPVPLTHHVAFRSPGLPPQLCSDHVRDKPGVVLAMLIAFMSATRYSSASIFLRMRIFAEHNSQAGTTSST